MGKQPVTRVVYVPLDYRLEDVAVVVRDPRTWRKLAEMSLDPSFQPGNPRSYTSPYVIHDVLIGVTGKRKTMDVLQGPFKWGFTEPTDAEKKQIIFMAAGGAALAAGAVMFFVFAPKSTTEHVAVTPTATGDSVGFAAFGRF